jgi:hypothetical protein
VLSNILHLGFKFFALQFIPRCPPVINQARPNSPFHFGLWPQVMIKNHIVPREPQSPNGDAADKDPNCVSGLKLQVRPCCKRGSPYPLRG